MSIRTFEAGTDLSTKQYFIVKEHSTTGQVALCSAGTDESIGIVESPPSAANKPCAVRLSGAGKVVLGGTVTMGDPLTSDSNGRAVNTTTDKDRIIGYADEDGVNLDTIKCTVAKGFVSAT